MIGLYDAATGRGVRVVASAEHEDMTGLAAIDLPAGIDALMPWLVVAGVAVADLAPLKAAARASVRARRNAAEWAGVTVPGIGRFDSDPDGQRKIVGAVVASGLVGGAFTMDWRLADNSVITLDTAQMAAVGLAMSAHVAACQARKNALDAQIDAATDATALAAIDLEAGWPS